MEKRTLYEKGHHVQLQHACVWCIRGGADKPLSRPTSRCRKTESILSLERVVCSCVELQVFSCYRGSKEACHATCAISTTSRRDLLSSFFFLQGKASKEIHAILKEALGEHAPSKTGWLSLKVVIFNLWCTSSRTTQNSHNPGDYSSNSRANLGRPPAGFRLNQ